jgi:hypothetical protein
MKLINFILESGFVTNFDVIVYLWLESGFVTQSNRFNPNK